MLVIYSMFGETFCNLVNEEHLQYYSWATVTPLIFLLTEGKATVSDSTAKSSCFTSPSFFPIVIRLGKIDVCFLYVFQIVS